MPRAPSEERLRAEKMYRGGKKLSDIAKKLGVSASTVRNWKARGKWDEPPQDSKNATSQKKKRKSETSQPSTPRGEKLRGNKNALYNKGNPNAKPPDRTKHGVYSNPRWDVLDDEEKKILSEQALDEEQQLEDSILLYIARERRIMQAINKLRSGSEVVLDQVSRDERKRTFDTPEDEAEYIRRQQEKVDNGDILPGKPYNLNTYTVNKDRYLTRWEQELSNVQSKKDNAIATLARIRAERREEDARDQSGNMLSAWVAGLKEMEGLDDD